VPWITPAALEQHNDTKDVNRAQRPLASRGKLVGNSVNWSERTEQARFQEIILHPRAVENVFGLHQFLPIYHQSLPYLSASDQQPFRADR
jgi:hypothetical protein